MAFKDLMPSMVPFIVALSTIAAVFVTSYFNLKMAKLNIAAQESMKLKELKLGKLEELYFLFDTWENYCGNVYLIHYKCYLKKFSHDEALNSIINMKGLDAGEARKYKMILSVYFPQLAAEYNKVDIARSRLVPFASNPEISKLKVVDFLKAQELFEKECADFKSKISALAHAV